MPGEKELDWDLRQYRIKHIASILHETRRAYFQARKQPSIDALEQYAVMLDSLYLEIFEYLEDDDLPKDYSRADLDSDVDGISDGVNLPEDWNMGMYLDELKRLRDLDKVIQQARVSAGLDIPTSTNPDPEDEFLP